MSAEPEQTSTSSIAATDGASEVKPKTTLFGYLLKNWLALFSAFFLGLGFPLWKMFVYEVADVSVEVTEVERKSDVTKIDVNREPAFKALFESRRSSFEFGEIQIGTPVGGTATLQQLERMLESKKDSFEREETRVSELKRRLDEIRSTTRFDQAYANRLNAPLTPEVEFDVAIFRDNKTTEIEQVRAKFIARFAQDIESREKGLADGRKAYDIARTALSQRQEQSNLKLARIILKGAVSNSGAGAISLRPQGFLRVYLGGTNYVDVELNMESYDTKGDMQPKSSKIVSYSSDPIGTLRDVDQEKINTYFKQNVPAALFIIDINGRVYQSNTIPFAQGLYQQSVFDKLRSEASKLKPPDVKH